MPTVKELKTVLSDRAKRLAQAEKEAPPLPPGDGMPGSIVLLGTWDRDTDGNYLAGPDGAIYEVWPDGRKRIARELPAGDFKMILGMNPFELV